MVAGSILPVSFHKGKIYFLFGKECPAEESAKGFSDFGGGVKEGETPYEGALREGAEELSGFLGDKHELHKLLKRQGRLYTHVSDTYHIHMFYYPYDESLIKYYNQSHAFLWEHLDKTTVHDTCLFEKIEIQWFDANTLKTQLRHFRPFYRKIVLELLEDIDKIKQFVQTKQKHNRTKKNRV
jgi:8-oxo-dGTP pyrophosphatase MutT (NUDIX family)